VLHPSIIVTLPQTGFNMSIFSGELQIEQNAADAVLQALICGGQSYYLLTVLLLIQPSMELVFVSTRMRCRLMFNTLSTRTTWSFSAELLSFPVGGWAVEWDYSVSAAGLGIDFC